MYELTTPVVTEAIGRISYHWKELDLRVVADRVTDEGTAELWFYHVNGNGDSLLEVAKANLLSSPTMVTLSKRMAKHSSDIPWSNLLTLVAKTTIEYQRRGEPGTIIEPHEGQAVHPGYYLDPIVLKGAPSIIYGDKGSCKTTLVLACLGIIALGDEDNKFNLPVERARVAILDWESNLSLTEYNVSKLIMGGSNQWFSLPYLRCKYPLCDDMERIGNFLHDNKTQVIAVDSLGQAAGSDKFDSAGKASALKFFEALRQLNLTPLIIAQNAKGENKGEKTIYGSTYYTYYARNIFELKSKEDDIDHNIMHAALFHREANYSAKHDPLGFNLKYSDQGITITTEEIMLSRFIEKFTQEKLVLELLKSGALLRSKICEALGKNDRYVGVLLNRLKNKGLIVYLGPGLWGLAAKNEDDLL